VRSGVAALAFVLSGCAPHYRVDADRTRRAMDPEQMQELLDAASEEAASGDHEGAVAAYLAAIDANPRFPASVYLALSRELADAGDPARAVAVTRFVLAERAGELGDDGGALDAVVARLAAQDLPSLAIELLVLRSGGPPDPATVLRIPELERQVGELVRAREHARAGRPDEAMRAYWRWASAYGVADHAVLRGWAADAIAGQQGAAAVLRASAEHAAAAGDFARAVRAHGLLLVYEPQRGPEGAVPIVESSRRAGDVLRLGPEAARRVEEAARAADEGHVGAALRAYRRAVLDAPWHPELRRNLATLLSAVGLYAEAVRQGEWLLALRPEDAAMREHVLAWRAE